jgi:hypothetical protein
MKSSHYFRAAKTFVYHNAVFYVNLNELFSVQKLPLTLPLDLCQGPARIGNFDQQLLVYNLFIQSIECLNKHLLPNIRHKLQMQNKGSYASGEYGRLAM